MASRRVIRPNKPINFEELAKPPHLRSPNAEDIQQPDDFLSALDKSEDILAVLDRMDHEDSLSSYIRSAWKHTDPSPFAEGWHLDAISEHLEAVTAGQIKRLIINIPPRHMKSLSSCVFWPTWTWIQPKASATSGPGVRWLFLSYAHGLSIRDNVKARRLMNTPWFQGQWGSRFAMTQDQNAKIRYDNDKGGYRIASSVDGMATGEGGDIIVIDDPHNTRQKESEVKRQTVIDWWTGTLSTRLNDARSGAYVVIMQRVHFGDLVGHILRNEMDFEHLCLPARFEPQHPTLSRTSLKFKDPRKVDGEPLWSAKMPDDELTRLERKLGSYDAAGQLQQRPAPREGGLFKRADFKIVRALPAGCTFVRGWDLASSEKKRSPYTVGVKIGRAPNGMFYIAHILRDRLSPFKVEEAIRNTADQERGTRISLPQDPGQAGVAQIKNLVAKLQGHSVHFSPESGEKEVRAEPLAAQVEAGNVSLLEADWNEAFLSEAEAFPNGLYLDQIDAAGRAFNRLADVKDNAGVSLGDTTPQSSNWKGDRAA